MGQRVGMARRIAEKTMWMESRVEVTAWGTAKTRVNDTVRAEDGTLGMTEVSAQGGGQGCGHRGRKSK